MSEDGELETLRKRLDREIRAREQAERLLDHRSEELLAARKQAEQAERRLIDALESISEGFMLVDRRQRLVIANRRMREFYPSLAEAMVPGTRFEDLLRLEVQSESYMGELDEDAYVAERSHQLAHPDPNDPWEEKLPDGRVLLVQEQITDGGLTVSLRRDITQQKINEKLLRSRLAAMESTDDGIALIDEQGAITYANQAYLDLFGYEHISELSQTNWRALYEPGEQGRIRRDIVPKFHEAGHWRGEIWGRTRQGERVLQEVSLTALADGGTVSTIRDVTLRRKAEEEQQILNRRLYEAQKLEVIGRMAGVIAHDFNNILAAVQGFSRFLTDELEPGSKAYEYAEKIEQASGRAEDLVQSILTYSRQQEVPREQVDLCAVVSEVADMLAGTLPKSIDFTVEVPEQIIVVDANATQINQLLLNLCVNAKDAIGETAGTLKVEVSVSETGAADETMRKLSADGTRVTGQRRPTMDGNKIQLLKGAARFAGPFVRIRITDTGHGMDRETLERIFDPFFTTKSKGKGSGLGMFAVEGIIEAHQGGLLIETEPGEGSTIVVMLPVLETYATRPVRDTAPTRREEDGAILVVDDDAIVGEMTAETLERMGYQTGFCTSAREAINLLYASRNVWDLVLSDQIMPEMTGIELTQVLREKWPDLPVVLISGYSELLDENKAEALGAAAFIRKPVKPEALNQTIQHTLRKAKLARGTV